MCCIVGHDFCRNRISFPRTPVSQTESFSTNNFTDRVSRVNIIYQALNVVPNGVPCSPRPEGKAQTKGDVDDYLLPRIEALRGIHREKVII